MLESIKKIFTESATPIKSLSSLKNYSGHVNRLMSMMKLNNDDLGKKETIPKILQYINTKKSASTKNQVVCAIKKYCLALGFKELDNFFAKEVEKTIAIRKGEAEKKKIIEKKKKNWINFKVLKKRYELSLEIVKFYHKLNGNLTCENTCLDYKEHLEFAVLLGLYLSDIKLNPPRRAEAWFNCEVVKKTPKQKNDIKNYIVTSRNIPKKIVLYRYKTFHTYGRQEYDLNPDLSFLLKKWIEFHKNIPGKNLFKKKNGDKWINTQFSIKIKNIIQKCCREKINVSTNMLRNICITEMYKDVDVTDIPELAKGCGHSFDTACEHYIQSNNLPTDTKINLDDITIL